MSLHSLDGVLPPRLFGWATFVAIAVLLAACAANTPAATSDPEPTTTATESASAEATLAASPSTAASNAAAPCLPVDIFAAVEDISNVVEPSVPADEIADAVEELDLSGFDDEVLSELQARLVSRLRDGETNSFSVQEAAGFLLQRTNLTEC